MKKRIFTLLVVIMALCLPAWSQQLGVRGDLSGDGIVDVTDVSIAIDIVLGKAELNLAADLDGNGEVDVTDISMMIDIVLGKVPNDKPNTQTFTVNGVSFTMVAVDGGTFTMGATSEQGSNANDNEKPAHQVTLSSFSIGATEVTQELWQAVMGSNPSKFRAANGYQEDLKRPVETVTREEALTFISRLNALTGQTFRLPTEAEWEFAARGGNKSNGTMYAGSNDPDQVAWCAINSGKITHAVGTKAPNELGLYDMSGNVYDWCSDYFGNYSGNAQTNPVGPASGDKVVVRGASWYHAIKYCRVSARLAIDPNKAYDSIGLRLVLGSSSGPSISTSESHLDFECCAGETATKTITIQGNALSGDVAATITSGGDVFSVSPTSIPKSSATNGATVTVTYSPSAVGTHNGVLKLTSNNAQAVIVTLTGKSKSVPAINETITVNGVSFTMVPVEGGTFDMGATEEQGNDVEAWEKPVHQVTLSDFSIGATEVTQELWQAVMGSNPSFFNGYNFSDNYDYGTNLQRPVEWVSWDDCQEFISKLNQLTGKNFRLPTEAEWEYAARGGNKSNGTMYSGSDDPDQVAWYRYTIPSQKRGTAGYGTQTVATKAPNELGLYDMTGNVDEWCQDYAYRIYSEEDQTNPTGPTEGWEHMCRGGNWYQSNRPLRVSYRKLENPTATTEFLGLRLAL